MKWYFNSDNGNFAIDEIPYKIIEIDGKNITVNESGWTQIPTRPEPFDNYIFDGFVWVEKDMTQSISVAIAHFEKLTSHYIQSKVDEYNKKNGLAFANIDAFTKYAVLPASQHNAIAIRFITYVDNLWNTVRLYQSTATAIPTDEEFKAILDGVVF